MALHGCLASGLFDDGGLGLARAWRYAERVVDVLLTGLGARGLAHVHGGAIGTLEFDGDAVLAAKRSADPFPAQRNTASLELEANHVHEVVSEHGDEQMAADAVGLVMKDRAQAEL